MNSALSSFSVLLVDKISRRWWCWYHTHIDTILPCRDTDIWCYQIKYWIITMTISSPQKTSLSTQFYSVFLRAVAVQPIKIKSWLSRILAHLPNNIWSVKTISHRINLLQHLKEINIVWQWFPFELSCHDR